MEKRFHPRIHTPLAMKYWVAPLESEKSWTGEGTLRNFSLGGVYLTCEGSLPLEAGDVHNFSIITASACDDMLQACNIKALGLVVRIERPATDKASCGIAVKFLTPVQVFPI